MLSISFHSKSEPGISIQVCKPKWKTPSLHLGKIFRLLLLWSILAMRGHFAKYRPKFKIQSVCKYNSSQCFVFYCFSFPHFHVFSLVITHSLPHPTNPLLFLYWSKQKGFFFLFFFLKKKKKKTQKVFIYLIHFFHYHLPMLKKKILF